MASYPAKIPPALQRLGAATVAIGFAAAVVASRVTPRGHGTSSLDQTRRMLHQVRDEVRAARVVAPNRALQRNLRKTEAALAEIAAVTRVVDWRALRALDDAICQSAESAVVFLSTGFTLNNSGNGSRTIEISTNNGVQDFTFASGTTQANIILAINGAKGDLAVVAAQSDINPSRVAVSSIWMDAEAWVRIKMIDGIPGGIICVNATFCGLDNHKDRGQNLITLSPFRP